MPCFSITESHGEKKRDGKGCLQADIKVFTGYKTIFVLWVQKKSIVQ